MFQTNKLITRTERVLFVVSQFSKTPKICCYDKVNREYEAPLAQEGEVLTDTGRVLAEMAAARTPNADPILPKQQDPMNLAEGG